MATIELQISKKNHSRTYRFAGPSKWEEISKKHLILWASTMCSNAKVLNAKTILAANLYGIPYKILAKILNRKERYRLSKTVAFLFGSNALYQWVIPSFRFGIWKYYGPKDKLSNITAGEFTLCEHCYEKFDVTKDVMYLDVLAAILYRPRRWFNVDDDIRIDLKTLSYEKRAERFKKLPDRMRFAIYLNYEGCRNFIIKNNREIFKSGGSTAVKITPWSRIVQSGAGGIFGTLKETEKSNIHKFLSELNTRLKEQRENKKP